MLMLEINKHNKCLVLNADHTPLRIVDWQRAVIYIYKNHKSIEVISWYNDYINTSNNTLLRVPAVIRIKYYYDIFSKKVKFSRTNIYIRDNYSCQYCGRQTDISNLTYDHIIPKSQWESRSSATCWTNIVTACIGCNFKKRNRTPQQAKMPLLSTPHEPKKHHKYMYHSLPSSNLPEEWKNYIKINK